MVNIKTILRDDYVKKDGRSAVLLVVHIKGKKVRFNTGVAVHKDHFKKGSVTSVDPKSDDYNLIISTCRARINDIFVKYRLLHDELTPQKLSEEYKIKSTYIYFYGFMEASIRERKGEITQSTMNLHLTIMNKLKAYKKELTFSEITEDLIKGFARHLKLKLHNTPGTVGNAVKIFKTYVHIALRKGIISKDPFINIQNIRSKPDRLFLTEEELRKLINLYDKGTLINSYQKVLRAYLFSCFTGLRISDLKEVTMENIVNDTLVIYAKKTRERKHEPVKIPLTRMSKKIIHDVSELRLYGKIFELCSDQKMNDYIKKVASEAEIDKPLSFHSARHTFATFFLRKTKNLAALQKLLGHSNIRETMIYSHVLMEDIEKDMKCFDELI